MRIALPFRFHQYLSFLGSLSTALVLLLATTLPGRAHEVVPAIADMEQIGMELHFDVRVNAESFIAGIDLTSTTDTDNTPQADDYDVLRALEPDALEARFMGFWPNMQQQIHIVVDGLPVIADLDDIEVGPVGNVSTVRDTTLRFIATLPGSAETVQVGWDKSYGTLVLRQQGVDAPYDGYLEAGALSDPIQLTGGDQASGWQTFVRYIPVGFDHIVPKGLDHILFVLGLFFLSTRMTPLLTQVSLFTVAHTITLALAALGYTRGIEEFFAERIGIEFIAVVEPLIAASIAYVAIENIVMRNLSPWRPFIVFLFGLLHGLGFASVLGEFGLPAGSFVPALVGFNIGVELGQLAVIVVMFLAVWQAVRVDQGENEARQAQVFYGVLILGSIALIVLDPVLLAEALENPSLVFLAPMLMIFGLCLVSVTLRDQIDAYRRIVSVPASVFIAVIGIYWFVERVFL